MGGMATAVAAPLDRITCNFLYAKRAEIADAGIEDDMAKGPEWALANLSKERLALIRAYIETSEQIAFRCPSAEELDKLNRAIARAQRGIPLPVRRPRKKAEAGRSATNDRRPGAKGLGENARSLAALPIRNPRAAARSKAPSPKPLPKQTVPRRRQADRSPSLRGRVR